ncbi:MAG TPA: nucleotidyltransferase family protein [Ferrovibrio sp.]|uniref:nucleotidyltransferase domain-containing protein n=1 Tax=Ferrovibrio sp. TaxID=1917215 RepID=UPI002B4B6CA4|nr:nucleotidyltransferase family protein [Ferrovibrio sp.]HLT76487.1 nucleotidyltransferase family protein [Ferrovibrio sp.]
MPGQPRPAMIARRRALRHLTDALRPQAGGAEAAARRRSGEIDWVALLALANDHLVAPALHVSLRDAIRLGDLPEDVRAYLAFLHGENAVRNVCLRNQAIELARALNGAGIRPMLLKGGLALFADLPGTDWAGDPGLRMMRDLDFQIPREQADAAFAVLQQLGYAAIARYPDGHHACGDFARAGDPGAVDLHFELIDAAYLLPAAGLRQRASLLQVDGAEFLVPAPTDLLLHVLLHAQIHYTGQFYHGRIELRQLLDYALIARRFDAEIDWDFIARHLRRHRLALPLQAYALAAEKLLGLPSRLPLRRPVTARLHYELCLLRIAWPRLDALLRPAGNLCAAFARYRMDGLYGRRSPLLLRRLRHALRFLRKSDPGATLQRLFKAG